VPHARRRVIIADDHAAVLAGLFKILRPHCEIVSTAVDGDELLQQVREMVPDVVITDIFMPKMNGLAACRHIRQHHPAVIVVMVSEYLDDDVSAAAFEAGASAVVRKADMVEELTAAVTAAA
jgi:DNA-binding NarL/FixJ family response regulator